MSKHPSDIQPTFEHNQYHASLNNSLRYHAQILPDPALTSYDAGWQNLNLEYHQLPAGETPILCFDHYLVAISLGKVCHADLQIDEIKKGQPQRQIVNCGEMMLVPANHQNWGCWYQPNQGLTINLKMDLLTRNATELLMLEHVELLPYMLIQDPLILQIGLALKADLEANNPGGYLYAETMATALSVHLLRNYSAHNPKINDYLGKLSPSHLQRVTDHIHDQLDQELSLNELAAIVQLSSYHFCRCFKESTGLTPHQYVIRQRVERAKILLKDKNWEIRNIAIACGFTHQSHLNRHFKRLTGLTPKAFSKSYSKS